MLELNRHAAVFPAGGETTARTDTEPLEKPLGGQDSDSSLVARAANGDRDAFGELVKRHQGSVYSVVFRMVADRDEADDITQEVFLQAFRGINRFRGDAVFSTWIHTIAVNTAIKHIRKMKRRQSASIDDPDSGIADRLGVPEEAGPGQTAERSETVRRLHAAIRNLPEKHRAVVVLHYLNDFSCEEIARIMKCSVGTVWSRLHYACRKLRVHLGDSLD